MRNKIIKYAILNALATAFYIALISSFLFYVPKTLNTNKPDTVFAPILMLSLLVFSVSVVGSLIFGRPILWCFNNKKKEASSLLIYTLLAFFIFIAIVFAILLFDY